MYDNSCEIIYKMISQRILARRKVLSLSNKDICPLADPNLISSIVHNRINPKKNPYLIPKSIKGLNDRTFIEEISANLKYDSPIELLLGTYEEIEAYSGYLFKQLLEDALLSEPSIIRERLDECLSDYLPYALVSSYKKEKGLHGDVVDAVISDNYKKLINKSRSELDSAIARVFAVVKDEFILAICEMFRKEPHTLKLNKRFSVFMKSVLLPLVEGNRRNNPFIDKAKTELLSAYEITIDNESYIGSLSPEAAGYHENDKTYYEKYNIPVWFSMLQNYIIELSNFQKEDEGVPNINLLNNWWKMEMCV